MRKDLAEAEAGVSTEKEQNLTVPDAQGIGYILDLLARFLGAFSPGIRNILIYATLRDPKLS